MELFNSKKVRSPLSSPIIMLFDPTLQRNKLEIKVSLVKFIKHALIYTHLYYSFWLFIPCSLINLQYSLRCHSSSVYKTLTRLVLMFSSMARSTLTLSPSLTTRETSLKIILENSWSSKRFYPTDNLCLRISRNSLNPSTSVSYTFKRYSTEISLERQTSVECWTNAWVSSQLKICKCLSKWLRRISKTL